MRLDILDKGFVELVDSMGSDAVIADSARLSYLGKSSGEESDERIITKLIAYNHTSPLEQVEFRFLVKAPIFVARQWMRHRTWSFSEISRRYTAKDIDFYIPKFEKPDQAAIYSKSVLEALGSYEDLVFSGIKKEQARGILPVCMYTTFYAKTDLHNLFHFLQLRLDQGAQYEIRVYADAICKLIEPIVPVTFKLWKNKHKN